MRHERLVFIDESGARTNMTRRCGRAKHGARCVDAAPCGGRQSTTMISSVRPDGSAASMVIDGATTAEVFKACVERVLLPTLRPGDVVVLDNLSAHKNQRIREMIESVGAQLWFLPAYSPDLNPIEKMWSKVRAKLRAIKARSPDALLAAIGKALRSITPSDVKGWFASCGYPNTIS